MSEIDHRCLACGKVHSDAQPVTLHDGRVVSSYSEEWRVECEARAILALPSLHARQRTLAIIAEKRGQKTADGLKAVMLSIWNSQRKSA